MSVVLTAMLLMVLLSLLVMGAVALPQLREGKTVFSQGGVDQMDAARRRAAALAGGKESGAMGRLRAPVGWTESTNGPRHAR